MFYPLMKLLHYAKINKDYNNTFWSLSQEYLLKKTLMNDAHFNHLQKWLNRFRMKVI